MRHLPLVFRLLPRRTAAGVERARKEIDGDGDHEEKHRFFQRYFSENQKKILKLLEKPSDTDKNGDWSSIFISRKMRKYRRLLIGFNSAMNN